MSFQSQVGQVSLDEIARTLAVGTQTANANLQNAIQQVQLNPSDSAALAELQINVSHTTNFWQMTSAVIRSQKDTHLAINQRI